MRRHHITRGRTLRLHRETLRQLTGANLARVAGGTLEISEPLVADTQDRTGGAIAGDETLPKSTGYTGGLATRRPTC